MERSKKAKTKSNADVILRILSIIAGAILGILLCRELDHATADLSSGLSLPVILGFFFVLWGAVLLQILIHEVGHLFFGLSLGYRFYTFRIGSLTWIKESNRIKFRKYSLSGTGGQCLMFLPEREITIKTHVLYHMGGSIFNAVSSILCAVVCFCIKEHSYLTLVLWIIAGIGLINALANGIPLKLALVNNDGHNAMSIGKDPKGEAAFCLQMKITEAESKGTRMKDMPDSWFSIPNRNDLGNSMVASTAVLACFRMMEQEKFIEADYLMEQLLGIESGMVGYHRVLLTCNRILIETLRENRQDRIRELLSPMQKKHMSALRKNPIVLRTEYALAQLSERNPSKVRNLRKEFDSIAKTYPYKEDIKDTRKLMALIDEKAQNYTTIAQQQS